jgi:hypothetical protein
MFFVKKIFSHIFTLITGMKTWKLKPVFQILYNQIQRKDLCFTYNSSTGTGIKLQLKTCINLNVPVPPITIM